MKSNSSEKSDLDRAVHRDQMLLLSGRLTDAL